MFKKYQIEWKLFHGTQYFIFKVTRGNFGISLPLLNYLYQNIMDAL